MFAFVIPVSERVIYVLCDMSHDDQLILISSENLSSEQAAERIVINILSNIRHFIYADLRILD